MLPYINGSFTVNMRKRQSLFKSSSSLTQRRNLAIRAYKLFILMCFYINWKRNSDCFIYTSLYFKLYRFSKYFLQDPKIHMLWRRFTILIGRGKAAHRYANGDNINLWDLNELYHRTQKGPFLLCGSNSSLEKWKNLLE